MYRNPSYRPNLLVSAILLFALVGNPILDGQVPHGQESNWEQVSNPKSTVASTSAIPALTGVPKLVNFEDLTIGTHVYNQYDSVTFVGGDSINSDGSPTISIVEPPQGTISPTQALQSHFELACEFCGTSLKLKFDVPQYRVSLSTGLSETYSSAMTILLSAYDNDPVGGVGVLVAQALGPCLGTNPTAVNTPLEVEDSASRILYIELNVVSCSAPNDPSSSPINATILIDNLLYNRALHPPVGEHIPPLVNITSPISGSTVSDSIPGAVTVHITATVTETAIYSLTVQVNGGSPFQVGYYRIDPQTYTVDMHLTDANGLVSGTNTIVLQATDFDQPQNTGSASVTFNYQIKPLPPPSQADIWPIAFDINQSINGGPRIFREDIQAPFRYEIYVSQLLVQGKPTLVRIYGAASDTANPISNVPATMYVVRDGCTGACTIAGGLAPLSTPTMPKPTGIDVPPFGTPDSNPWNVVPNLDKTWSFLLQPEWTNQDLVLIVQINSGNYSSLPHQPSVSECESPIEGHCYFNNEITLHLHFVPPPEITVTPVYIRVQGSRNGTNYDETPTDAEVDAIFQKLNELYPARVQRGARRDLTVSPDISKDDLLDKIKDIYGWGGFPCLAVAGGGGFYLGIFPGYNKDFAANTDAAGYGSVGVPFCGSPGAWADADDPIAAAHELAHNIGFNHWACENGVDDDECGVFPIPHGGIGGVGVDLAGWKIIPPGDNSSNSTPHAHDFMSYGRQCGKQDDLGNYIYGGGPGCNTGEWVSWYDYNILKDHSTINSYDTEDDIFSFLPFQNDDANATLKSYDANFAQALLVSGRISPDNIATFRPIYQISTTAPFSDSIAEDDSESIFTLQGYDAQGNTLFVHNFEPAKLDEHTPGIGESFIFDQIVPIMVTLQKLTLRQGLQILGTLENPSPGIGPSVIINTPTSGAVWPVGETQVISWTTISPAGLALSAFVQYSPDGGATLIPLGRDITATTLTINPDELAGSDNAFIYVQVSDGLNTAEAQAGPFTVAPKPPSVHIISPQTNSELTANIPITLQGTAFDRQEELTEEEFQWSSNIDGALGAGQELTVMGLSAGMHTLTLTVNDSQGRVGQDSVNILVITQLPNHLAITPEAATNPVGTDHTVTATLTNTEGDPVSGQIVEFNVTGANTNSGQDTTDTDGQATFEYTGENLGDDTITAWVDINGNAVQDPGEPSAVATKTWIRSVKIDIQPGKFPNRINTKNENDNQTIQVAILSTKNFDAPKQVDQNSLTFGHTGNEHSLHSRGHVHVPDCRILDVNHDRRPDLVCKFVIAKARFKPGDNFGILKGKTVEEGFIQGRDSVVIVRDDDHD